MTSASVFAHQLSELLDLAHPPVAVTFDEEPATGDTEPIPPQPSGCCFWAPAEHRRFDTQPSDHANCSIGSYIHGLIDLNDAATGDDTAALVGSGWIGEKDLHAAPHLPMRSASIRYEPLAKATDPDVVLIRLSPGSLMTLQGACPELQLATKPQCQIVPLAYSGQITVSPGCAVSRVRAGLPPGELTCALPTSALPTVIERLRLSVAADHAVTDYAITDSQRFDTLI
jgi:uncharacterized protein (DUF169 family)